MIARIKAGTGYIALSLHTRADGSQVWRPIGDASQGLIETSLTAAVRACIRSIDERFRRLRFDIAAARAPSASAHRRSGGEPDVLDGIEAKAAGLHREVVRLLDEPTAYDEVLVTAPLRRSRLRPNQLKAGRLLSGLGLRELSARTGHSLSTIQAIENGCTRRPRAATLDSLQSALVDAGIEFDSAGWVRHSDDSEPLARTKPRVRKRRG